MAAEALDCGVRLVSEPSETLTTTAVEVDSLPPPAGAEETKVTTGLRGTATPNESDPGGSRNKKMENPRAEIDTSAPFESVKEAATRFGGFGFWRPRSHHKPSESQYYIEAVDIAKVEERTSELEKDLIAKERETLDVLKELETTKTIVEELKLKLQKEASEVNVASNPNLDAKNVNPGVEVTEKRNHQNPDGGIQDPSNAFSLCPSSAPGFILMELKQAKLNLTKTTNDLADIRATVESFNKKIEKERLSLERTRERLSLNSSKISSLEEELKTAKMKLQVAQDAEAIADSDNPISISSELQRLSSETEQYKKMGEAAKSEVLRAMTEIEQTKTRIKTAEIRLVAAKKMKAAARATEAVALAEIKALSSSEVLAEANQLKPEQSSNEVFSEANQPKPEQVTLSFDEYSSLTSEARDAEEASNRKVIDAMLLVDEANLSKLEILKRVEEATKEVKNSKVVLEEALNRVGAANRAKLGVEEALRKWRSEHGQKRRSVQKSTKFKNSYPSQLRKDSHLLDVNGSSLVDDDTKPVLRPTLSIGQILSRKLLLTEEFENGLQVEKGSFKRKISLGQMLNRPNGDASSMWKAERESSLKQLPVKRKKFGFARLSVLVRKQSKKKKKPSPNPLCRGGY
ncbi:WEB family protein At2g38370 [Diospyros lotus]|uniref:WEB family protein At2g38370 n=1 Tax=Diospyros lotus TaxID=55363 RepID=UPI00224D35E3|nr:WEB family protein At2g38370 [Diospyros lotus]